MNTLTVAFAFVCFALVLAVARLAASGRGRRFIPPDHPSGTVLLIQHDDAAPALHTAGYRWRRAKRVAGRGRLYHFAHDGVAAIYIFFVNPAVAEADRLEVDDEGIRALNHRMLAAKRRAAEALRSGDRGETIDLNRRISELEDELERAEGVRSRHRQVWRLRHGHTAQACTPQAEERLARDAGAILAPALPRLPGWKKDANPGFVIEFDESELLEAWEGELVPAQSKRGANWITLHRGHFYKPMASLPEGHAMPTASATYGAYAIPHELGHLLDERNMQSPWSSMEHVDVWDRACDTGQMSDYGRSNPREGYAEAFALWLHDPDHPVARAYAERFEWECQQRSEAPIAMAA